MQQHLTTAWIHQPTQVDRRAGFVMMTRDQFDARVAAGQAQDPRVGALHLKFIKRVPPNQLPVNIFPAPPLTTEADTPLPLALGVTDTNSPTVTVRLQTAVGHVHVGPGGTITGNDSDVVTVLGTLAQVNASLAATVYTPQGEGNDPVIMTTTDGHGGQAVTNGTIVVTAALPLADEPPAEE